MVAFVEAIKKGKEERKKKTAKEKLDEKREQYNKTHPANKRFAKQKKRTAMAKASRRINRK